MRTQFEAVLKQFFCERQTKTRAKLRLTQEQMANRLKMEPRSYSDLCRCKNSCSALTLACYLIYCCEDPMRFLLDLHDAFKCLCDDQPQNIHLEPIRESTSYRKPKQVTEIFVADNGHAFPVCPRCKVSMEREFMRYCDRCGQMLDWHGFPKSAVIYTAHDRKKQRSSEQCSESFRNQKTLSDK